MPLGNFLQGLGQQAGYQIIYGQEKKAQDQALEIRQQQVEAGRIELQQKQSAAESRLATSAGLRQALSEGKNATETANILRKGRLAAYANMDLEGAAALTPMIKDYEQEESRAKEDAALKSKTLQGATADSAADYLGTKSPEAADSLIKNYLNAGGKATDVPVTPSDFDKWAEVRRLDGMDKGKKAEFMLTLGEKKKEAELRHEEKSERLKAEIERDRANATLRETSLEILKGTKAESRAKSDFDKTEKLNSSMERSAKPYIDDRNRIESVRNALSLSLPQGDQQASQALTSLLGQFKGHATNLYYKDNKSYGSLANRIYGFVGRGFTGKYSEADRIALIEMLDNMETQLIDPALTKLEIDQKKQASRYGLDPEMVNIKGDFTRKGTPTVAGTPPAIPTGWTVKAH